MEMEERKDDYDVVTETEVTFEDSGFSGGAVALIGAACVAIGAAGSWVAKKAKKLYDDHKAKKGKKEEFVDAKPGDYKEVDSEPEKSKTK